MKSCICPDNCQAAAFVNSCRRTVDYLHDQCLAHGDRHLTALVSFPQAHVAFWVCFIHATGAGYVACLN